MVVLYMPDVDPTSDVMEQIVFRDGCSMEIPGTNWDRTHSVNFAAKIDRTNDKQQKTTIGVVMKTLVDGLPVNERNLCSYEVRLRFENSTDSVQ